MAHHNNTPASVLAAPPLTPVFLVEHTSPNRAMRRHWHTLNGRTGFIPKSRQAPSFNEPHVKAEDRADA